MWMWMYLCCVCRYSENAKLVAKHIQLECGGVTPTAQAANWVEYALATDGALFLRPAVMDMDSLIVQYNIDVLLFFVAVVWGLVWLVRRVCCACCCRGRATKTKQE